MNSYNLTPTILLLSSVVLLTILKEVYSISVAAGTTEREHELICRRTRDDKPGGRKNTTCVFPFKFDGITYDGVCTNETDPNGEFWCSTETDKRGRHKPGGGHWGYCHDGCDKKPVIRRTVEEAREHCSITLSEGGPKPNTKCVWPFKFNKKVYDGVCSNEGDPEGKFWCSTKTGKKGKWKDRHLKGGNWGYCQPGCNVEPIKDLLTRTTETSTERISTKPTKPRRQQTRTKCKGIYCDIQFWDKNLGEIKMIEENLGNWEDFNNETEVGNYLPNEKDLTCGSDTKHGYIIGGEDSKMGEFPFLAALGYRAQNDRIFYSCGATLINRRYVVTAAHCHNKEGPIDKRIAEVVLGDYDLSKNPDCVETKKDGLQCYNKPVQRFNVQESDITVHEGFDKNDVMSTANDIALVRLEKPAFTAAEIASGVHVLPICLPWGNLPNGYTAKYPSEANVKNTHLVMGWGRTNNKRNNAGDRFSGGAHSNILQQLEVPFVTNEMCRSNYKAFQNITRNKQICAGGIKGKDSCQGDSGGPLIVREGEAGKMYLRGITSFGTNQCGFGYPGVYTDISYYVNWIKEHLKP